MKRLIQQILFCCDGGKIKNDEIKIFIGSYAFKLRLFVCLQKSKRED